jgi:hypothetical protein
MFEQVLASVEWWDVEGKGGWQEAPPLRMGLYQSAGAVHNGYSMTHLRLLVLPLLLNPLLLMPFALVTEIFPDSIHYLSNKHTRICLFPLQTFPFTVLSFQARRPLTPQSLRVPQNHVRRGRSRQGG